MVVILVVSRAATLVEIGGVFNVNVTGSGLAENSEVVDVRATEAVIVPAVKPAVCMLQQLSFPSELYISPYHYVDIVVDVGILKILVEQQTAIQNLSADTNFPRYTSVVVLAGSFFKYVIEGTLKLIEAIDVISVDQLNMRTLILLASTIKRPLSQSESVVNPSVNFIDEVTEPADDISNFAYILLVSVPVAAIKTEEPSAKTLNSSDQQEPEL